MLKEEISSGGVVVFNNSILLLKKFNGDWVLPKGKIEPEESLSDAALREVFEESGVRASIQEYLGEIHYTYKENWDENRLVHKTVHWYLMSCKNMETVPQKEEGFVEAKFIHFNQVLALAKYNDESSIIKVALDKLRNGKT